MMKPNKAEQNAREFIKKTGIGEPFSALSLDGSHCAMWKKGNRMLKVTFHPSGLYSLSYRSNSTTLNYKGNLARPLGKTTLKAIQEVSENDLDFFSVSTPVHRTMYLTDTTSNTLGDIVEVNIERTSLALKKEGHKELKLSMENFLKIVQQLKKLAIPNSEYIEVKWEQ